MAHATEPPSRDGRLGVSTATSDAETVLANSPGAYRPTASPRDGPAPDREVALRAGRLWCTTTPTLGRASPAVGWNPCPDRCLVGRVVSGSAVRPDQRAGRLVRLPEVAAVSSRQSRSHTFPRSWRRSPHTRHTARLVCPVGATMLKRFPSAPIPESGSRGDLEIACRAGNHVARWNSSFRLLGSRGYSVLFHTLAGGASGVVGAGGVRPGAAGPRRGFHLRRSRR